MNVHQTIKTSKSRQPTKQQVPCKATSYMELQINYAEPWQYCLKHFDYSAMQTKSEEADY